MSIVFNRTIVTMLMFPLLLQSFISNRMRPRTLMGIPESGLLSTIPSVTLALYRLSSCRCAHKLQLSLLCQLSYYISAFTLFIFLLSVITVGMCLFFACRSAAVFCAAVNDACHSLSWRRPNKGRSTHIRGPRCPQMYDSRHHFVMFD